MLLYTESKGPFRAFAAEVIQVENDVGKIAIFHPLEEFRIITVTKDGEKLIGPRDTTVELREPNVNEKKTIARMRDQGISRFTESERRSYENPGDDGKKKKTSRSLSQPAAKIENVEVVTKKKPAGPDQKNSERQASKVNNVRRKSA